MPEVPAAVMPEEDDALEVRLPASVMERFTALLVANPPLGLMTEETFAGLEPIFELDCALLYRLDLDLLEPIAGAGRGTLHDIGRRLGAEARSDHALWRALDSGVPLFTQATTFGGVAYTSLAVLPLPGFNGTVRGALVFGRVSADPPPWRVSQQRTLIAASRVIAVNLERSLDPRGAAPTNDGVALSNLARLLDGVRDEPELRTAALEVLRPHLAGASLAWLEHDAQGRVRVLEFDGNETLEAGLRQGALPDDHSLLEALCAGRFAVREGGDGAVLGVTAWCAMPARAGLTLLAMRQSRLHNWTEGEQRLLRAATKTLGACCDRLATINALVEARARAEFLAGLSDALQTASTPDEVSQTAMALLGPNVRALNILTLRLQGAREHIRVSTMGAWGSLPPVYAHYLAPEGVPLEHTKLTRQVFETRQPYYDAGYVRQRDPARSRVALGLEPIIDSQGQVLAVFSVGRDPALGAWLGEERELLARAAATVGLALERAEVRLALEASRNRAQVLASLANALQRAQTAEEVAALSMELLGEVLHAQNIITLRLEARDGERFLRSMGIWGELPAPYSGYFQAPGVNINLTRVSKHIVDTGEAFYDTDYLDPDTKTLEGRRISVGLEPIKDQTGAVIAIFSVGREARHGAWTDSERELMTQAAMTIGLAIERTRNREELEARAKALEDKSAEMEAFVFSVSHDLKSPMVSLEGMSTLLEEAVRMGDGSELEFFLTRLRANVQTMTGLVGGLLELSRIGRVDESLDCVDVGGVVHTVIQERMVTILANRITVDTSPDFPFVTYSPERLYQLFSNLIGNAIKFLPDFHPAPRIEVSWRNVGTDLEFSVADNGRGIPEHLKTKSLELFSRLEPSIEGTGVGLAMVKRILDYNEGRLRLEDTPGGGLTVVFSVPRTRWVR
jgi:signal transduction histidine kinase